MEWTPQRLQLIARKLQRGDLIMENTQGVLEGHCTEVALPGVKTTEVFQKKTTKISQLKDWGTLYSCGTGESLRSSLFQKCILGPICSSAGIKGVCATKLKSLPGFRKVSRPEGREGGGGGAK
jgi:hypothetical protein